jgi:putative transposase
MPRPLGVSRSICFKNRSHSISDNGSSYIANDLAQWLDKRNIVHIRGTPNHPQTQGKIERWHQTLKNRILLENYYLPGDLEAQVGAFIGHYNHRRYHESLKNLTPAEVYPVEAQPPCYGEKGSNSKLSKNDACITKSTPPKLKPKMG